MKRRLKELFAALERHKAAALAAFLAAWIPCAAFAWTAPVAGDFGYEFYNFAVNIFLHGAFGELFCLGLCVAGFAAGISSRMGGWAIGIPIMILGGGLYNIDALATALGWIV